MAKKYKLEDFTLPEIRKPSKDYLYHLNNLVQHVNRNTNLQINGNVTQSQNSRGSKYYIKKVAGAGGTGTILFGTVTQTLSYDTEVGLGNSTYLVDIDGVGEKTIGIWDSAGVDLRNFVPWLTLGSSEPILLYSGNYYFISNSFIYCGIESQKSISFNAELGITQAVFS